MQATVRSSFCIKFFVRADVGDGPILKHYDPISETHVESRCAMTNTVRPLIKFCSADCTNASDSLSSR